MGFGRLSAQALGSKAWHSLQPGLQHCALFSSGILGSDRASLHRIRSPPLGEPLAPDQQAAVSYRQSEPYCRSDIRLVEQYSNRGLAFESSHSRPFASFR